MKSFKFLVLSLALLTFVACQKEDNSPAGRMAGSYQGTFNGTYNNNSIQVTTTYPVEITKVADNEVLVTGADFDDFEVVVVDNGTQIQIQTAIASISQFVYTPSSQSLVFQRNIGSNTAQYSGVKQ